MGAQMHRCTKKGEGVHWLALACTDLILCSHDLILCYGWYWQIPFKIDFDTILVNCNNEYSFNNTGVKKMKWTLPLTMCYFDRMRPWLKGRDHWIFLKPGSTNNEYLFIDTGVKKMKWTFGSHEVPFPATSDRRSLVAGNITSWEAESISFS